jgi:stage V sporulation protein SpoVS
MSTTDWQAREVPFAMSDERLAAFVDREVERHERMMFTLTPREELDAIGRAQALADQAFAQEVRAIAAAHSRACKADREFAADELALALGVGLRTAERVLTEALGLAALPGMVEALHAGMLTQRHALAVLRTLDEVELSGEQRCAIAMIVLARLVNQTPHELAQLTRKELCRVVGRWSRSLRSRRRCTPGCATTPKHPMTRAPRASGSSTCSSRC